jgi:ribosomal protein S18 acetylase RimI-like enzyme
MEKEQRMTLIDESAVKIRRMTTRDVEWITSIWWANIPNKEMVLSQRGGRLDASFMAEYEGHLVGFILARIIYAGLPMTGAGVISLMAVRPDHQHRGIGTMLLNHLQSHCKSEGIHALRAPIPESDTELIKYFQDAGFRPGTVINYDKSCD